MPADTETSQGQDQKTVEVAAVVKTSVFIGIFLLRILSGVPWIWENLVAYVTSFYYAKGDDSSGALTNWVLSSEVLTFNFALLIGKTLISKIGLRTTLFFGIFLFNGAIFLTYFSVQHSIITLCVTFGLFTGFAGGLIEAVQLILIVRWTKRYHGLSTSSVQSALILGAVALNLSLTWFINTNNEEANSTINNEAIFTQQDIIGKVPSAFLLYGISSFILNMTGFFLVRDNPGQISFIREMINNLLRTPSLPDERVSLTQTEEKVSMYNVTSTAMPTPSSMPSDTCNNEVTPINHSENIDETDGGSTKNSIISNGNVTPENDNGEYNVIPPDFTPRQALKTRSFYTLLVFKIVQFYAFFILNTYFKTFGLLYIPDDHFLTATIMVKCLVTPVCTWIAGFVLDKFGVKPTLIVVSCIFCFLSSFFYLSPFDKWVYFMVCVMCGCALYTMFCLTGACCIKLFGETHFTTIFGMTFIPGYVILPILPPLTKWIISVFGWFILFTSVAFLGLINVIALLWGLPEKTHKC